MWHSGLGSLIFRMSRLGVHNIFRLFAVLQMASSSRFVDLNRDVIIKLCDEQENEDKEETTIYDFAIFKEFLAIYN